MRGFIAFGDQLGGVTLAKVVVALPGGAQDHLVAFQHTATAMIGANPFTGAYGPFMGYIDGFMFAGGTSGISIYTTFAEGGGNWSVIFCVNASTGHLEVILNVSYTGSNNYQKYAAWNLQIIASEDLRP